MAQYLILIYGDEAQWDARSEDERRAVDAGHAEFRERAGSVIISSGELESSRMATSLRPGGEQPLVTDGPFLETKEVLGGFYLVDVPDLDAALRLAGLLHETSEQHGGVQVQPLVDHS
ncbi:YciI family protein [Microbacterium yannicii]|uniref:YciI family protein n=1 Tax=Microbacterium yannicii TaxID=671622 RepID=A0ABP9MJN1_9MICO|nr:YciI family protein [Microbacterium yannicii]MCO5951697.1 YciI family protein [Microbacterium yannicii]